MMFGNHYAQILSSNQKCSIARMLTKKGTRTQNSILTNQAHKRPAASATLSSRSRFHFLFLAHSRPHSPFLFLVYFHFHSRSSSHPHFRSSSSSHHRCHSHSPASSQFQCRSQCRSHFRSQYQCHFRLSPYCPPLRAGFAVQVRTCIQGTYPLLSPTARYIPRENCACTAR
jgi:hypothetical protein